MTECWMYMVYFDVVGIIKIDESNKQLYHSNVENSMPYINI